MSIEASLERIAVAMETLASGTRRATTEAAPAPKARAVKATQSVAEPAPEPTAMTPSEFRVAMLKKMAKTPEAADKVKTYLRDVVKVIGLANVPAEKYAEVSAKIDEFIKGA